jgi:hypothetical protein
MWLLTERFLARFAERAAAGGWRVDTVDDDDFAGFTRGGGLEVEAQLGLDLTPRDFGLSLNPSLGVRHSGVGDLAARLLGFGGGAAQAGATLVDLVYEAGRRDLMWVVESEDDIDPVVQSVLADLETYGEPFFARFTSLSDLIDNLERSATTTVPFAYLAVAHAISGNTAQVSAVLRRMADWAAQQPPLVAQQAERFLAEFGAYFDIAWN